jgi:hypothetical protein
MTVVNVTGRGILKRIGIRVTVGVSGTPSAEIRIIIDGVTVTIPVWAGATTFAAAILPFTTRSGAGTAGSSAQDSAVLEFLSEFRAGMAIEFHCTVAGSAGTAQIAAEYETTRQ